MMNENAVRQPNQLPHYLRAFNSLNSALSASICSFCCLTSSKSSLLDSSTFWFNVDGADFHGVTNAIGFKADHGPRISSAVGQWRTDGSACRLAIFFFVAS